MTTIPDPRTRTVLEERPWGDFRQFCCNDQVTVKIITVRPGARLSLQRHAERAELWVVLDDALEVTVGERTWQAQTGEQVWVPLGATHRISNPGPTPARVLEIAHGHFDESDIQRLEDDYSRA